MISKLFQEECITFPKGGSDWPSFCLASSRAFDLLLEDTDESRSAVLLAKFQEELFMTFDNDNKTVVTKAERFRSLS
jgi:hypothetical protein